MPTRSTKVFYQGRCYTVKFAKLKDSCPAEDFLASLSKKDWEAVVRIIKRLTDVGKIRNTEQFKKISGTDFWEFKAFQIRVFCYFAGQRQLVVTHGYKKKQQKLAQAEIDRMRRIRNFCEGED